jgi:Centromere DNA-binding protein complex CBF3 subunit, domain 2
MLQTTSGILRTESLYRAELSDFLGINPPKRPIDVHPMYLLINQNMQGKTNKNRTLYGRSTRHCNVVLCCIGAIALYLTYRFWITNKFAKFTATDWCNNQKWFDVKLLIDVFSEDYTKPMQNDSYAKHIIWLVLKRLKMAICKLLHLGRNVGAKLLELMEEEDEAIRRMGQWNPSIFDNSYSVKLPMSPIRKLAGYGNGNGLYFNTRTQVFPSDELK